MLPSAANVRLHHTSEARLPSILSPSISPLPLDSPHTSPLRPCVPYLLTMGHDTTRGWGSYCGAEYDGVGTEDTRGYGGEDTSR